jgi:hypothetical protein
MGVTTGFRGIQGLRGLLVIFSASKLGGVIALAPPSAVVQLQYRPCWFNTSKIQPLAPIPYAAISIQVVQEYTQLVADTAIDGAQFCSGFLTPG